MVQLQVIPIGLNQAKADFAKAGRAFTDLRIPFERTIIYMHSSWGASFRQGGRGGKQWKKNTPATKLIKGSGRVLEDTGSLRSSLTGVTRGSLIHRRTTSLEIGTTLKHAEIQDKGKTIGVTEAMRRYMAAKYGIILGSTVEIPARPFMFFQKKDIAAIEKIFNEWLNVYVAGNPLGGL